MLLALPHQSTANAPNPSGASDVSQDHTNSQNVPRGIVCRPFAAIALPLADLGCAVFPLKPHTKEPCLTAWQRLATTDPDVLEEWSRKYPSAGVGILTGHRSQVLLHGQRYGIAALDCDPRHGSDQALANLQARHVPLPPTWTIRSGRGDGGGQLLFAMPHGVILPYATSLDGLALDMLGEQHNSVGPGSLHESTGQPYTWDVRSNPHTMPIALCPEWLLQETLAADKRHNAIKATWCTGTTGTVLPAASPAVSQTEGTDRKGSATQGSHKVPPPLGTLCDGPGAKLMALACDAAHLPGMLEACGLPGTLEVGHSTRCPFHDDQQPSATLLGPTAERHSYGLFCHACKKFLSLTDIFHAKHSAGLLNLHTETDSSGRLRHHTALRLQWTTRLLEAAGVVHLYELGMPSLPRDVPEDAQAVWEVFLHVRRVRSATRKAAEAMPFSLRFIQDWAGKARDWTAYQVNKAKRWLVARGFLVLDGSDEAGERLWRIGRQGLRRTRVAAPIRATERENVADVAATSIPAPVQTRQTTACPDDREPGHEARTCVYCAQARLLAIRARNGPVPLVELSGRGASYAE